MLLLKPLYNRLYFIDILLSPNIYTFSDIEIFPNPYPIFSILWNLNILTSQTKKFQLDKFLPYALSPTQSEPKEPKSSQINPHLNHETAVHMYTFGRCCLSGALIWLAPIWLAWAQIAQPTSNHLKSSVLLFVISKRFGKIEHKKVCGFLSWYKSEQKIWMKSNSKVQICLEFSIRCWGTDQPKCREGTVSAQENNAPVCPKIEHQKWWCFLFLGWLIKIENKGFSNGSQMEQLKNLFEQRGHSDEDKKVFWTCQNGFGCPEM